ncbi:hypothetical protein J437_LFUL011321 [Ladona fulva]|uniref:Kazal-like domain-containing protein n=1 Tax=Ladona fulva TaxID=123851 RepID=A0A8K0KJS0_LADFU|nr:hypothetical protein J437_LFUL011321 [Ladona fulva]
MSHRPMLVLRNNSITSDPRPQSRVGFTLPRQISRNEAVRRSQVECGASIIPRNIINCCCPPERCNHAKLASPQSFVAVLICLLIIHGAIEGYLKEVLSTVVLGYNLPKKSEEWILVAHKLSQVLVGILIAHTASANRPKRLGGYMALWAVSCCTLITPHLVHDDSQLKSIGYPKELQICHQAKVTFATKLNHNEEVCWEMFGLLLIFQFLAGISYTALMSHGITYMDDNVGKLNSPAYFGAAFGVGYIGRKIGTLLGWICLEIPLNNAASTSVGSWWLGWPYLSVLLILGSFIVSLFPNVMPSTAVKSAAKKILSRLREEAARSSGIAENLDESPENKNEIQIQEFSLLSTLKRLLTNKMIISSIIASIFLEAALYNFEALEPTYLEAIYQIPKQGTLQRHGMEMDGFKDPWMSRLITGMLKAPLIAMTLIVSGLLLSRIKPKASSVAAWAASMSLLAAIITALFLVMTCPSIMNGRFYLENICNIECNCNEIGPNSIHTAFTPVCSQDGDETFFSPCHAGCKTSSRIRDLQVFGNCSCVSDLEKNQVVLGACVNGNSIQCRFGWIFFQGSLALLQILVASGMIGKLLLCLRCVIPQDKPMVFGLEMSVVSLFAYVPFKLLYNYLKDFSCSHRTESGMCQMHDPKTLALSVNLLTSGLLFLSALFTIWMAIIAKNFDLYEVDDEDESYYDSGYDEINEPERETLRESRYGTPWPVRKMRNKKGANNNISQESKLLQMVVSPAAPSKAVPVDESNTITPEEHGSTEL